MASVWDTLRLLMFYNSRKRNENEVNPETTSKKNNQSGTKQKDEALVLVKGSERQVTSNKSPSR